MLSRAAAAAAATRIPSHARRCNNPTCLNNRSIIIRNASLWSKVKSMVQTILGGGDDTPRKIQEREELNMSILAATHLELRNARQGAQTGLGGADQNHDEDLIDEAVDILEQHNLDSKGILSLRWELQKVLEPQVMALLETFAKVDRHLEASKTTKDYDHDTMLKSILRNDYVSALSNQEDNDPFWQRKRGALHTILVHQGWTEGGNQHVSHNDTANDNVEEGSNTINNNGDNHDVLNDALLDDFGYNPQQATDEVTNEIRHYQTINLCRSALIKKELDYSTLALKSTIPQAGRGIFVDGQAMAGSIVAFIPGEVWPKEYLLNASLSLQQYFEQDSNYQLSLRYDDVCIDSRKSPYTVLSGTSSSQQDKKNPWAIGHVCNHPPPNKQPNCRTIPINFTQPMKLSATMMDYVPNTYAREPMLLGPKAVDRDVIVVHGMALQAIRDVQDEELFYDYRLSPGQSGDYPAWYHVANQEELNNRWSNENKK